MQSEIQTKCLANYCNDQVPLKDQYVVTILKCFGGLSSFLPSLLLWLHCFSFCLLLAMHESGGKNAFCFLGDILDISDKVRVLINYHSGSPGGYEDLIWFTEDHSVPQVQPRIPHSPCTPASQQWSSSSTLATEIRCLSLCANWPKTACSGCREYVFSKTKWQNVCGLQVYIVKWPPLSDRVQYSVQIICFRL